MKKRFISFIIAAAMAAAPISVFADATPKVVVDGSPIMFDDQAPVIVNERTLIPARGVFEAMGAKVEWDADERKVDVTSEDNITIVRLYIDNPVMEVYKFENSLFNLSKSEVTLEAAPQIMNDRTMIPLRAISEALDATVNWDKDSFTADILTGKPVKTEAEAVKVSLSADVDSVAAGEEFDLYVSAGNLAVYPDTYISSVMATVEYDKANYEFVEAKLVNGDAEIENALGVSNPDYSEDKVKSSFVTIDTDAAVKTDGKILKITMRSLTGKEGSFKLSNGYFTYNNLYDTGLILTSMDGASVNFAEGTELVVDRTPVIINAGK